MHGHGSPTSFYRPELVPLRIGEEDCRQRRNCRAHHSQRRSQGAQDDGGCEDRGRARHLSGPANAVRLGWEVACFAKVNVKGKEACDLYKTLTALDTEPVGPGKISWNFEMFIIGRDGEVVARFSPRTKPDDPAVLKVIEAELAKEV